MRFYKYQQCRVGTAHHLKTENSRMNHLCDFINTSNVGWAPPTIVTADNPAVILRRIQPQINQPQIAGAHHANTTTSR